MDFIELELCVKHDWNEYLFRVVIHELDESVFESLYFSYLRCYNIPKMAGQ